MSAWTHNICPTCWNARNPLRAAVLVELTGADFEVCCFCGRTTTSGIYLRHDPKTLACVHTKGGEGS